METVYTQRQPLRLGSGHLAWMLSPESRNPHNLGYIYQSKAATLSWQHLGHQDKYAPEVTQSQFHS